VKLLFLEVNDGQVLDPVLQLPHGNGAHRDPEVENALNEEVHQVASMQR
jgi:hypothetical protein